MITVLMGTFAQRSQHDLGTIATRIYDEAFLAVSYMREAQNELMNLTISYSKLDENAGQNSVGRLLTETVPGIVDSLQVAHDRAMSPEGRAATEALIGQIKLLGNGATSLVPNGLFAEFEDLQQGFDTAVEIYAGDGFLYRQSVEQNIERSTQDTWIVIVFSLVAALIITALLSRSIVPALQQVVGIAKSIAAGKLDNRIEAEGSSETGEMLVALDTMQTSIASHLHRINSLMAEQASSHAGEMAVQHERFEAALNNMTQGLCLFDADGTLSIFNWRFVEMFGEPTVGAPAEELISALGFSPSPDLRHSGVLLCDVPDGRVVAVAHQPVESGGWVATYEDVTERRRVEARFAHMARHDALTGLPNRVMFREHIEEALSRSNFKTFYVLSLDLDGFKAINDTLGHPVGDRLLEGVAQRLLEEASDADIVARLGGDEFVVIQQQTAGSDTIPALAQRLIDALRRPFTIDGHTVAIGVSVGIASTDDLDAQADAAIADTMLKNADLALYRAKWDGRGTYRFFEVAMDARLQARRALELDLQTALESRQFEVYYQPLIDTERNRVAGFEALLRWNHPVRGKVPPAEFIPVAEETGLIRAIGAWVLEQACAEAARWPEDVKVAVNLSPVQFSGNLVEVVARALQQSGLAAARLELEITESLLLQDNGSVLETLHQLRAIGARIAMDDFGTGYSSLSYLQRFPFDKIKIDQAFIRQLPEKQDSVAIVRAVIGLGKSLGMSIIAEGVETAEQLAMLQAEGCWDVQGYFFSPPRPAREAMHFVQTLGSADDASPMTAA
ncbi:hypothetical protein DMC47_07070 [Nostoc sp. 3335mG]|nr:hypothetical protein DMC47_07070 [Nostoc sp. 3335mG]